MAFRKVTDFKEITILYQSNGPATLQFYTDMPGGVLAPRLPGSGFALPSTGNTRKTTTIALDNIQGTEYYPVLTPAAATQLFLLGGTIWLRPIGVYLDGSLGEIWQTQPIAPGA